MRMIVTSSHTHLDLAALRARVEDLQRHARRAERQIQEARAAAPPDRPAGWRVPLAAWLGKSLQQIRHRLRQRLADPALRARIKSFPLLGKLALLVHALRQLPALRHQQASDRARLERLEAELQALAGRVGEALNAPPLPDLYGGQPDALRFYSEFSRRFRGSEEAVAASLRPYLERITARFPEQTAIQVVDIGCGNGTWLRVLAEHGLTAIGFDLDGVAVQAARAAGLDARLDNGICWLRQQPTASLDVITAFHLIEHLEPADLLDFFCTAARVLKHGGLLICETPNPENLLVGACTFYMDLTHRHPIPHTLAKFIAEFSGFPHVEIVGLHPFPARALLPADSPAAEKLNALIHGPQDYALVAQK
jgi:O-antigen chain-terminating methyltransferase